MHVYLSLSLFINLLGKVEKKKNKNKSSEKFCGNFAPTSCELQLQLQLRVTATRMSYLISLVCGLSMAFRPDELLLQPWLAQMRLT